MNLFGSKTTYQSAIPKRRATKNIITFLFAVINFLANFWLGKLDPDIHHDGYVLAGAVAFSDGLMPNRDFFAQYGPFAPAVQGLFLNVTESSLQNLRLLNGLLLTFSFTLALILMSRKWDFYLSLGLVSCVAFSYTSILPPMTPWPSVIMNFIYMLIILLIGSWTRKDWFFQYIVSFLIGVLLGATVYFRIHSLSLIFLFALVLSVQKQFRKLLCVFCGFFLLISITTYVQISTGSFYSFLEQTVFFPFEYYTNSALPFKVQLVNLFLVFMSFFYLAVFIVFIKAPSRFMKGKASKRLGFVISCVVTTLFFLLAFKFGKEMLDIPVVERSFLNPKYALLYFAQNLRHLVGYCLVALFLLYILQTIRFWQEKIRSKNAIYLAFAVGSLTQLFPSPDYFHLWWISPILLACLPHLMKITPFSTKALVPAMLALGLSNILFFKDYVSADRIMVPNTVIRGMYSANNELQKTLEVIINKVPSRAGYFHCPHGIYAVAGGHYLANGSDFVDWGPQTSQKALLPGLHFYCESKTSDDRPTDDILWQNSTGSDLLLRVR